MVVTADEAGGRRDVPLATVRRHKGTARQTSESPMRHTALCYGTDREFLDGTVRFVRGGLAADEAVLVALPAPHADLLHTALGPLVESVHFTDLSELGRNPARMIARMREFVEATAPARARVVGEPFRPERSSAEARETARYEALVNVAFAEAPLSVLCAYDWTRLPEPVLADAGRTHPELVVRGERRPSVLYRDQPSTAPATDCPLPPPPPDAPMFAFTRSDLSALVEVVWRAGTLLGLPGEKVRDLMYAASEIAMKTFVHGRGAGELRLWQDSEHLGLVCEFRDSDVTFDPLVSRAAPTDPGLGLVDQHCDLVEIRTDRTGTTVRLHVCP